MPSFVSPQLATLVDRRPAGDDWLHEIARGKFSIERGVVDVRDVVSRAIEASRPLIESRGHKLDVTMPVESMQIVGDEVRLTQAILNLLNNAAEYTPDGGLIR